MSQPADAASPSKHGMPTYCQCTASGRGQHTSSHPAWGEPVAATVVASSQIMGCHILMDHTLLRGAGGALSGDGEPLPWQLPAARCPHRVPSGGQPALLPYRSGPLPPWQLLPILAPSWTHSSPCCAWRGDLWQYPHLRDAPHP